MPEPDREDRIVVVGAGVAAALGPRVGFAGELFFPGGGVEPAWTSGVRLARLSLAEENR
jgi:hypothetical protein